MTALIGIVLRALVLTPMRGELSAHGQSGYRI